MTTIKLYTGGGVSLSPQNGEGRTESEYVRLVADDGKGITDGNIVTTCVDTKTPEAWTDCDAPDYDDTPEEHDMTELADKAEAYDILMGVSE